MSERDLHGVLGRRVEPSKSPPKDRLSLEKGWLAGIRKVYSVDSTVLRNGTAWKQTIPNIEVLAFRQQTAAPAPQHYHIVAAWPNVAHTR